MGGALTAVFGIDLNLRIPMRVGVAGFVRVGGRVAAGAFLPPAIF